MALSADDEFNLEVLKLLLHVAKLDGQVDTSEVNLLRGLGRGWQVPEGMLQKLVEALQSGRTPAEPNWALLKTRADDALQAARAMVLTDGKVHGEEIAWLKQLQQKLEG